ncbi:MAG: MerR family transcriptional regulator [Oscillospiraceae bacterium]|nr:MerR family transcriptional regulator [Oscillospiraceae bacterium]
MRIKEVCGRTGLTRRAVRFYEEKGLVSPGIDPKEHNDYRDYSEEDVKRLSLIAGLRSLRIPVEDIARILKDPMCSGDILSRHRASLDEERAELCDILDILAKTPGTDSLSILADRLERARKGISPDTEPDFSRFEELTEEERARFSDGGAIIDRIRRKKRKIRLLFALAAVVVLIAGALYGRHLWKENQMLGVSNAVGINVQLLDLQAGEIGGEYHFYAVVKFEDPPACAGSDTMHLPMDTKRNTGGMVDALIVGETYAGMNIHGSVPRKVAREYGLLNEQGYLDAGKAMELFYTDEVFAREYFGIDRFYSGSQIRPLDKVFAQDSVN